ncbi:AbrB family transcriptional regulator [Paenibacillus sp. FSL H8-0537]|uniref:AbrB family transcriptional regulator n=1 Tax=Paenibacillus sp. FSL H8-0537 TaxID=2921399 RepID=UPI0031018D22
MIRFLITLALALTGGFLFTLLQVPLSWLLGPMVFAFIGSRLLKERLRPEWPSSIRDTALIMIGYSIGLSLTLDTLRQMGHQLPTMVLMTVLLLLFSGLIAVTFAKLSGLPLPTVLMGCIPGGLSQMVILAEDTKGIDITVVTFLQVSRLMMIIFCVPLLVFSPLFGGVHEAAKAMTDGSEGAYWAALFPGIVPLAIACVAAALLAKRIKMPSAYLLGPMIATAIIHGFGVDAPVLPSAMINAAQLMIGTYVGLLLRPESLKSKVRMTLLAVSSGIVLLVGAFGLTVLLGKLHAIAPATAFLSMAPGGMDQMGIMAKEIHADIAIVSCYQLFRIWFIYFAVPPLLRLIFKRIGGGSGTGTASGTAGQQPLKSQ